MVLSIELQDNIWAFNPGDTITGKVVIDKRIWNKVEGLSIRLYGKLEVGQLDVVRPPPPSIGPSISTLPTSSHGHGTSTLNLNLRGGGRVGRIRKLIGKGYHDEIVLVDMAFKLLETWKVLKPGRHEFEFNFTLPEQDLPPTFKTKGARVHYEFVTSLKRPRDDFKIYQTPFYIHPSMNDYENERFEEYFHEAQFRCSRSIPQFLGCCMNGSIIMEGKLDKTVFPLGGNICFSLSVTNELRSELSGITAKLIRKFKFKKSKRPIKDLVTEITGPYTATGDSQIWNGSIVIPNNIPATNIKHTNLFQISYNLQFSVRPTNNRRKKISLKFPLVILPNNVLQSFTPFEIGASGDASPPPTYEEATQ